MATFAGEIPDAEELAAYFISSVSGKTCEKICKSKKMQPHFTVL